MKYTILTLALLGFVQTATASTISLHCVGNYTGNSFDKKIVLTNEGEPIYGSRIGSSAQLIEEYHYCGTSMLFIQYTDKAALEVQISANQGCSYTDHFETDVVTFYPGDDIVFKGQVNNQNLEFKCSVE